MGKDEVFAPYSTCPDAVRVREPYWSDDAAGWVVSDYANATYVLRREELFQRIDRHLATSKRIRGEGRNILAVLNGPEHMRHHSLLLRFLDHACETRVLKDTIHEVATDLLDRLSGQTRADLASSYADELPLRVGAASFGYRGERMVEKIRELKTVIAGGRDPLRATPAQIDAAADATSALGELLLPHVVEAEAGPEAGPEADLTGLVWQMGRESFDDWSRTDTLGVILQCVGGGETAFSIRNLLYLVLWGKHRVQKAGLGDCRGIVEEALRLFPAVQWAVRVAGSDIEVGGAKISAGDSVFAVISGANRDSARFTEPDRVDTERRGITTHLSFGTGPRFCVGAELARVECREALTHLQARFPDAVPDPASPQPCFQPGHIGSFAPLWVQLGRVPTVTAPTTGPGAGEG